MKPDISFIFVNFRSAELLNQSLSSIFRMAQEQDIQCEYIIVNNDPDERLAVGVLSSHEASPRILHQERNEGFGRANNVGARVAGGEVLFFVNPDTEMMRGDLPALCRAFRSHRLALYGMVLSQRTGEREPWSAGAFPSLFRVLLSHVAPELLPQPWRAQEIQQADWVSGAAFAIRQEFFHSIGGFDEAFFLYFEDVDLARRATNAGGWVGVYPFIEFRHAGGKSHKSFREKKRAYYTGQRQYFQKWRPVHEGVILSIGHRIWGLCSRV